MDKIFDLAQQQIRPFLEMSGYEPKTTFFTDFTIADAFGIKAVEDTFNRAFEEWKNDIAYMTELTMVLNWKIWVHNETNEDLARKYNELWEKADEYCMNNFEGEDLQYFLRTTD
jgi:hypothetical protein